MQMDLEKGILAVDVGGGTQDILVWHPGMATENCPKMVMPSPTVILARKIDQATEQGNHLFLTGHTMGGGASAAAVKRHLKAGLKVFAQKKPALTLHDDLEKVEKMGIQITDKKPPVAPLTQLKMGDMDLDAIRRALDLFHVILPENVAVSVQDHGFSPSQSNRAFRFKQWKDLLESGRQLNTLLYETPPRHLTRMRALKDTVPSVWVMDSGAAAILGALQDPWVQEKKEQGITIVNMGNEHTLAALLKGQRLWGIYEHHTALLDPVKLERHLDRFRGGALTNQEIFDDMGHGCQVLDGVEAVSKFTPLSITGPNRGRFSSLNGHMAAPFGDMMLTGCFGLLAAATRCEEGVCRNGE